MRSVVDFLAVATFVFLADFLWLGILMKGFYSQEIGPLMRQGPAGFAPRLVPALVVYLLIPAGVILFVGPRIGPSGSILQAAGWGALFGFVMYGIYDMSNLAVLQNWTTRVAIVDMLWGTFLCGASAVCLAAVQQISNQVR